MRYAGVMARTNTTADELLDRLVQSVAAIPDPIARAQECVRAGESLRAVQARLATVRRRAIYEATLKPGATGRSVAEALGVSAKTVSLASSEFRRHDLNLMRRLIDEARPLAESPSDIAQAEALLESTSAVGLIAHAVAQLFDSWIAGAHALEDDTLWWEVHQGFERARYLSELTGLGRSSVVARSSNTDESESRTPPRLRWPCRVLNAIPGIYAYASTIPHSSDDRWTIWWSITSADEHLEVGDVGPSVQGWLASEWLVWLVRDYRLAGKNIDARVTAPPPMLNEPGSMMTFFIDASLEGPDAVDPHEFARSVIELWSGDGEKIPASGYSEIDWPAEVNG